MGTLLLSQRLRAAAFAVCLPFVGCHRDRPPEPVIVGRVVDGFGHPVVGASVTIHDSAFRTTTDAQGAFSLGYAPGSFRLEIEAQGCHNWSHDFNITQAVRYPLGTKVILRLPDGPPGTPIVGTEAGYRPLPELRLPTRLAYFGPTHFNHCVEFHLPFETRLPTLSGTGILTFFPGNTVLLTEVRNTLVTSDEPPAIVGHCSGPARALAVRTAQIADRQFVGAESLPTGRYCFIPRLRFNPSNPENARAWCFRWTRDTSIRYMPTMTDPPPANEGPTGQTGDWWDRQSPDDFQPCQHDAQGRRPCTVQCYLGDRAPIPPGRLPDGNPDFTEARGRGECVGP